MVCRGRIGFVVKEMSGDDRLLSWGKFRFISRRGTHLGSNPFALTVGTCCPLGINSGLFKVESLRGFRDFGSLDCHRQISGKAENRTTGITGGSVVKRVASIWY